MEMERDSTQTKNHYTILKKIKITIRYTGYNDYVKEKSEEPLLRNSKPLYAQEGITLKPFLQTQLYSSRRGEPKM